MSDNIPNPDWAPPQGTPFTEPVPAPPKQRMSKGKKVGLWVGGILVAFVAIGALGGDPETAPTATPPAAASSSATTTADPAAAKAEADAKAAADRAAKEAAIKAAKDQAAKEAAAKAAAEKAAAEAATAEKAKTDKDAYDKITRRGWAKIAKNPDSYVGETYVLHGYVTQFDAATGNTMFLANLDGARHGEWYEYDTNTIVEEGIPGVFDDVVQDDLVTLYVEVVGSFSYDTQIGGNTTAPHVTANIVKVTGSTN
ncbi:MAG TPA: hypothetical protein VFY98_07680 [Intrasporangium sp.]|nr:hypothetical protein [Intrasporangium sp.]